MARGRSLPASNEEKIAKKIGKEVSDYSLDLEAVGWYLAKALPYVVFSRSMVILESAQHHKEEMEKNKNGFYTYDND
jgi:hypothetical protein